MTVIQEMLHGDCLREMKKYANKSFEVVVTSPPYNIGMSYNTYDDRRLDYNEWTIAWLTEAMRVSKRGIILNLDASPSRQTELYSVMGAISSRFHIQNTIVWTKSVTVDGRTHGHFKPVGGTRYVNHTHEMIFHVVEKGQLVDVDRLAVGVPFTDKSNIARFKGNKSSDLRCGGSTWHVPYPTRKERLQHPASFPIELATKMILYAGGVGPVLDPFGGSGTTLMAARALNRSAVGIEIDHVYAEMFEKQDVVQK